MLSNTKLPTNRGGCGDEPSPNRIDYQSGTNEIVNAQFSSVARGRRVQVKFQDGTSAAGVFRGESEDGRLLIDIDGSGRLKALPNLVELVPIVNEQKGEDQDKVAGESESTLIQHDDPQRQLSLEAIALLRTKLLDLTNRNRLLNFRHSERSRNHIRVIDELPNVLYRRLADDDELKFRPLDEPPEEPEHEQSDAFLIALNAARQTDEEYLSAAEMLDDRASESDEFLQLERELKDRVREALGLPPRLVKETMSPAEYLRECARQQGLEPSYSLPHPNSEYTSERFLDDEIQTLLFPEQMERKLSGLRDQTRQGLEETGINTLFIAYGFLEWFESESTDKPHLAPLLLQPLEIKRKTIKGQYVYSIKGTGEEAQTNLTLTKRLTDFGIALPSFGEEDEPEAYFQRVHSIISDKKRWQVRRFITIGIFSYGRLVMWNDLDPSCWPPPFGIVSNNPLTRILVGGGVGESHGAPDYEIDDPQLSSSIPFTISDADASQLSAVIDANNGNNLAIKGPPGTGKSQTITNIIASSLYKRKKVLFVAEKMAALEVVKKRLDEAGLGIFCLELHSAKAKKKDVLKSLESRLEAQHKLSEPADLENALAEVDRLKEDLNTYVHTLNTVFGNTGKTIQELIWAEQRTRAFLNELPDGIDSLNDENAKSLTKLDINRVKSKLRALETRSKEVLEPFGKEEDHPWFFIARRQFSIFEREDLLANLHGIKKCLCDLTEDLDYLCQYMGIESCHDPNLSQKLSEWLTSSPIQIDEALDSSLLVNLQNREHLHRLERLLQLVTKKRKHIDRLDQWSSNPDSVISNTNQLSKLGQILAQQNDDSSKKVSLDLEKSKAEKELDFWTTIVGAARNLMDDFAFTAPPTPRIIKCFLEGIKLAHDTEREVLFVRSEATLNELNIPVLKRAVELSKKFREERQFLHRRFYPKKRLDSRVLRSHANVLRESGAFSFLASDFKAAKNCWKELSRTPLDVYPKTMADELDELASHIEKVNKFLRDKKLRDACGTYFNGLKTDFELILACCEFADKVRANTAGLTSADKAVRNALLYDNLDKVLQIASRLQTQEFDFLSEFVSGDIGHKEINLEQVKDRRKKRYASYDEACDLCESLQIGYVLAIDDIYEIQKEVESIIQIENEVTHNLLGESNSISMVSPKDLNSLKSYIAVASALHKLSEYFPGQQHSVRGFVFSEHWKDRCERITSLASNIRDLELNYRKALDRTIKKGEVNVARLTGNEDGVIDLRNFHNCLEKALTYREVFNAWVSYGSLVEEIQTEGLEPLLSRYNGGPFLNICEAYERAVYRSLVRLAYSEFPILKTLSGLKQESARARFRELDAEIVGMRRQYLASVLCSREISVGNSTGKPKDWTDLELIWQQIKLQKKHRPIRELMRRASTAIQDLKPCFMMSPVSVAQFLEPASVSFDLVVIDEASQMKPEEAIGAIARGTQVVVVGDPMQLPPTSFFDRMEQDENEELEEIGLDAESILDKALIAFHPFRELRWHYRSRHESLIAYSNKEFYDEKLIVFPSPLREQCDFGVSIHKIDGTYHGRGGNIAEVEAVATAAQTFMRTQPHRSLGIVTLNLSQAELLRDELDRRELQDSAIRKYRAHWSSTLEPLFVKNLENVQGDERDVIFISTVYGPGKHGKVLQRFGPINQDTGHRRLNVLFTRAKEKVEVFSSMVASDILVQPKSSWGVRALKGYLAYASTGQLEPGEESGRDADSDFELYVSDALSRSGYEVVPQVGVQGFFIDLAVKHPAAPNGFLLGIECDGATYHSARSARDRDVLRQEILENLGWKIYRIWSTDWFNDPASELKKLIGHIESLVTNQSSLSVTSEAEIAPTRQDANDREVTVIINRETGASIDSYGVGRCESTESNGEEDEECVKVNDGVVFAYIDEPNREISVEISPDYHAPIMGSIHKEHALGRALLGASEGEIIEIEAGGKLREAKILRIKK